MAKRARWMAAVLLAGAALAGGPAGAGEALEGTASVRGVNLVAGTVTLDSRVFAVDDRTSIVDAGGKRIGLAELPVAESVGGGWRLSGDTTVHYEATEGRGPNPLLTSLHITGQIPH
jgi:hypothetical protein